MFFANGSNFDGSESGTVGTRCQEKYYKCENLRISVF